MKYFLLSVLLILSFWVQPIDSMATTSANSHLKKGSTSYFTQHTVQKRKSSIRRSFKERLTQKILMRKLKRKSESPIGFLQTRKAWMFWVLLGLWILLMVLAWVLILGPMFKNIS